MPLFENRISPLLGHIKIRDFFILPSVRQSLPEFLFFNGPVLREGYKAYTQAPRPFRDVVEELGLNDGREKFDKLVFHSLRHSGATRLGQSGIPLRDMMDLAGWKAPSMALRYQHGGDAAGVGLWEP